MGSATLGPTDNTVTIFYDAIESLQWFMTTTIEPNEDQLGSTKTKDIPSHKRRRGPSDDAPMTVGPSTATYLVDPTLKSGNARPGKWFVLWTTDDADDEEKRRFTYTGSFYHLHAVLQADVKYPVYLRAEGSGRHTINPVIGGGGGEAARVG